MLSNLLIGKSEENILDIIENKTFNDVLSIFINDNISGYVLPYEYAKRNFGKTNDNFTIGMVISYEFNFNLLPRNKNDVCMYDDNITIRNNITKLPHNLTINGSLTCSHNTLSKLPNGLIVKTDLEIDKCEITELPHDLVVGNNLYIVGNKIKEIPETIEVSGTIFIEGTLLDRDNLPSKFNYYE